MLTEVPAKILRLQKGILAEGYDADIAVFDENICVTDVFVAGKKV
jgi:N-acetylglucosamine-6-phosphate deacetylase